MTDELKPCPFCGASGMAVTSTPCAWNGGGVAWNVTCHTRNCHGGIFALGVDMFATPAEAIAAWNTRADDARIRALEAERDRLREALELADAALRGANMNMNVVERKVRAALKEIDGE